MSAKLAELLKYKFRKKLNITLNIVIYCLVFVAKASFILFNHGF